MVGLHRCALILLLIYRLAKPPNLECPVRFPVSHAEITLDSRLWIESRPRFGCQGGLFLCLAGTVTTAARNGWPKGSKSHSRSCTKPDGLITTAPSARLPAMESLAHRHRILIDLGHPAVGLSLKQDRSMAGKTTCKHHGSPKKRKARRQDSDSLPEDLSPSPKSRLRVQ